MATQRAGRTESIGGWAGLFLGVVAAACATSDAMRSRGGPHGTDASCTNGVSEDCYSGPRHTSARGACRPGRRTCERGTWSECLGQVTPTRDLCNGIDDDCDGVVDNGFERQGARCFLRAAKGACRAQGRWRCSADGTQSTCDARTVKPSSESCNATDDDCDGEVDEDAVPADRLACRTGRAGVCAPGTNTCINGAVRCVQNVQPGPELCNGIDDDCNNQIDDDCTNP